MPVGDCACPSLVGLHFVADAQARLADPGSQDVQGAAPGGAVLGSTADFAVDGDVFAIEFTDP